MKLAAYMYLPTSNPLFVLPFRVQHSTQHETASAL